MKKYFSILKAEFMTNIQYTFNIALGSLGFLLFVATFYYIWHYIYSDPSQLINGYTANQMIWYLAITEIIYTSVKASRICKEVSKDVKTGGITYNLNKPYSYVLYFLFKELGKCVFSLIIFFLIGLVVVYAITGEVPLQEAEVLAPIFITFIFAQIIAIFNAITIGLMAFFIEDSSPLYWMYSKFMVLLGVIFPIEFFPAGVQQFLKFTPVYVTAYGPAKLFVDFSTDKYVSIIIAQVIYVFISYGLSMLVYNKGAKRLNINGG
jgi:ABC-2 type transport system permease protein